MKTKKGILLICSILLSGSLLQVNAQESLNRVMEKAEQLDYVKLDLVEQRNPETKQLSQRIMTITWKSEDSMELMDEFRAAFEREKENTTQAIYSKENGVMLPTYFTFTTSEGEVSYSSSLSKSGKFSVTRIENPRNK